MHERFVMRMEKELEKVRVSCEKRKCKKEVIDEPRRVLNELSKINLVDAVLPTSAGVEIRKRCVTRPTEHQEILLQYLGLNRRCFLNNFA